MIPIGTLVNILSVLLGGSIGLFFNRKISPELNSKVFHVMGLFTLFLGMSMALVSTDFILILVSLICGLLFGEYIELDGKIKNLSYKIKLLFKIQDDKFSDGFMTAFILYCVGSMTIIGSIDEGLGKHPDVLYVKSIMDGISSIILASTFGIGVLFSVIPMLLFQGGITYLTFYFQSDIPEILIDQISGMGGLMIIAIGLKILGYNKINPNNLIPSFVFIVVFFFLEKLYHYSLMLI